MLHYGIAFLNGTGDVRVQFPNFGLGHLGGLVIRWQACVVADVPEMNLDWCTFLVPWGKPFHAPLWHSISKWNMSCEGPFS